MKTIVLKEAKEFHNGQEVVLRTVDIIRGSVNTAPEGGFTPASMYERFKIIQKLDGAKDQVELDDSEYAELIIGVKTMKWALLSPFIYEFLKEVQ